MNFRQFKKQMKKQVFTFKEACIVAFRTPPSTLKVQFHQWKAAGEILPLKRGLYMFVDGDVDVANIAGALCEPCYISLEYALNHYGLLPDVPFAVTLVTTKTTRKFNTPRGQFTCQKIPIRAFMGFDTKTLMAKREKAIVDYLYLNQHRLVSENHFWEEMRWQNLGEVRFQKAKKLARFFSSPKLNILLESLRSYAKTHPVA